MKQQINAVVLGSALLRLFACSSGSTTSGASTDGGTSLVTDAAMDSGASVWDGDVSPQAAETKKDLVFRTVGDKSLAGDLWLPDRTTPVPAVIQIHGGGFSAGTKDDPAEVLWSEHLISQGFAAFSVNYRLYSDFSDGEIPFPSAPMDIKCSIMWLRKNALNFRVDPNHIFVLGGSAGGYMTNFLGTTGDLPEFTPTDCADGAKESNRLQGVVTYFGPSDFNQLFNDPARVGLSNLANGEKKFIGLTGQTPCAPGSAEASGICKTASATTYIDASDPPFYVTHSDDDPVVPVTQGRYMSEQLKAGKVDVTYHEVTGMKHGWHANWKDVHGVGMAIRDEVVAWLKARSK